MKWLQAVHFACSIIAIIPPLWFLVVGIIKRKVSIFGTLEIVALHSLSSPLIKSTETHLKMVFGLYCFCKNHNFNCWQINLIKQNIHTHRIHFHFHSFHRVIHTTNRKSFISFRVNISFLWKCAKLHTNRRNGTDFYGSKQMETHSVCFVRNTSRTYVCSMHMWMWHTKYPPPWADCIVKCLPVSHYFLSTGCC